MLLIEGELCVCQIVEVLGLAASTVSKHLSILQGARLVVSRKEGRWAYYRLPVGADGDFVRPVLKWLADALPDDRAMAQDAKKLRAVTACAPESLCRKQRARVPRRANA
jgi:ArsR family transcriptional regulator